MRLVRAGEGDSRGSWLDCFAQCVLDLVESYRQQVLYVYVHTVCPYSMYVCTCYPNTADTIAVYRMCTCVCECTVHTQEVCTVCTE